VRVHSQCLTGDLLGSLRCDCGEQMRRALAMMDAVRAGRFPLYASRGARHWPDESRRPAGS
jgi:GTP cyclohydrolase II